MVPVSKPINEIVDQSALIHVVQVADAPTYTQCYTLPPRQHKFVARLFWIMCAIQFIFISRLAKHSESETIIM